LLYVVMFTFSMKTLENEAYVAWIWACALDSQGNGHQGSGFQNFNGAKRVEVHGKEVVTNVVQWFVCLLIKCNNTL